MADEDDQLETDELEAELNKGLSKNKLIIIAVVALLLMGAAGGGVWYYLNMTPADNAEVVEGAVDSEEGEADGVVEGEAVVFAGAGQRAIYHRLRPAFVVTFDANNRQRYMQAEVTVVTRNGEAVAAISSHDPLIRNALVMLFSRQDFLDLQTAEGKRQLKLDATKTIQDLLLEETGVEGIEDVLFTNFVMQ